jgi:hypothetical protein
LRVGLKLTAVVLRRQRGSSIPNKRRPMDQALSSIFWMQKGQPCKGVSVFRSLQRTSWPSSIPIAPYRRQYCFKTQRSFAEKDRSCAECRGSSLFGRALGRSKKTSPKTRTARNTAATSTNVAPIATAVHRAILGQFIGARGRGVPIPVRPMRHDAAAASALGDSKPARVETFRPPYCHFKPSDH